MRLKSKGFTLIEVLVAMILILLLGIALARGVLALIQYNLKVQIREKAIEVVNSWSAFIESLPYDSWVISPGENSEDPQGAGGNALYCFDCVFRRGFCDTVPRNWRYNTPCSDPNDPNCFYCSFMDPFYTPPFSQTNRPYDADGDGIIALLDPYHLNNNCRSGEATCSEENMKYRFPSWFIAGTLRLLPDWGQGSQDCVCRLGNCPQNFRIGNSWTSADGSRNFRMDSNRALGGMKCTYELRRGVSEAGVAWQGTHMKVHVGITVQHYFHINNPVRESGKAIGIIAWYFDPVDKNYRAVNTIVYKERP